jgi:hypothetical protein
VQAGPAAALNRCIDLLTGDSSLTHLLRWCAGNGTSSAAGIVTLLVVVNVPLLALQRKYTYYGCLSAGSVHSVSSVLSSAFAESAPQQRTSGSGAAAGQQLLIHPLSEPADELACFEEEDVSLTAAGRSSSAGDGSMNAHHLGLSSPGSSSGQQQQQGPLAGHVGHRVDNSWGMDQQQWQQQAQGSSAAAQPAAAGAHGGLERKGSLKGALRSVVAWGSGLGQRLQRGSAHEKQASHKQQQQQQQQQGGGRPAGVASSANGPPLAGPHARQQQRAVGSGQELASM